VKLASELQKRSTGRTLYVLDEPTTGLHFEDIRKLLGVLGRPGRPGQHGHRDRAQPRRDQDRRLAHRHGPEGGSGGGDVVVEGTPEDVAASRDSHTGRFLRPVLEGRAAQASPMLPRARPAAAVSKAGRRTTTATRKPACGRG
jgi:excinuclease ABC subunit A